MYRNAMAMVLFVALGAGGAFAADKTFDGSTSTAFSVATNWDGDTLPALGDNLIIDSNCVFDLASAPQYGNLTVNSGDTLSFSVSAPNSLKVVDVGGAGTIDLDDGHLAISDAFDLTTLTFDSTGGTGLGRVEFTGTGMQTIPAASYSNLFITGNRGMNVVTLAGVINITGTLDISGVIFDFGLNIFPDPGSTVVYNGTGAQTIAALQYENLTIISRTGLVTLPVDVGGPIPTSVGVAGVLSLAGSPTTYLTTGSTVVFNGFGTPQTIPTVAGFDYNNLIISNNTAVTYLASPSYQVAGDFSAGPITINTSTSSFNFIGSMPQQILGGDFYDLSILGTARASVSLDATITIFNSFTIPATFAAMQGVFGGPMSEVVYAGSGAQTVAPANYNDLTINDRTGLVTFTGGQTYGIAGVFSPASGAVTYSANNSTFDFNGLGNQTITTNFDFSNLTISGTNRTSVVTLPAGTVFVGKNFLVPATFMGAGGVVVAVGNTVDYNQNGPSQVAPLIYDNFTISGFHSGSAVTFAPAKITEIRGVFTDTDTGATRTMTNAELVFSGNNPQTIPGSSPPFEEYSKLTLRGTGAKTFAGNISVLDTLTLDVATANIQNASTATVAVLNGNAGSSIVFGNAASVLSTGNAVPTDSVYSGTLTGAGTLLKTGTNKLTLNGPSSGYVGTSTLSMGTLELANPNALGTGIIQANSGVLIVNNVALNCLVQGAGATVRGQGNAACDTTVSMGSFVNLETVNGADVFSVKLMSQSGPGTANYAGPGRLVLLDNQAPATYFDGVVNLDVGTAQLNSGTALGFPSSSISADSNTKVVSNSPQPIPQNITLDGSELSVMGGDDRSFAGLISVSTNSSIGLRDFVTNQARNLEISGVVVGSAGLAVSGPPGPLPPKLKLTGFMSVPTNIGPSAELEIAPIGSFSSSMINVGTGGILTTTSNGNAAVTVNLSTGAILRGTGGFHDGSNINSAGGFFEPGPLTGTGIFEINTGMGSPSNLALDANTVLNFDLATPASSDQIQVSGGLILDGLLNVRPGPQFGAGTYTLFTHGGLTNNTLNLPPAPPGLSFALDTTTASNEVRLVVAALPITLNSQAIFSGVVGESFTYPIVVSGPPAPPITLSTSALPPGLRREGANIVGSPTVAGVYSVTLTATNGVTTATQTVSITIIEPVPSGPLGPFAAEGRVGSPFFIDIADFVEDISDNVFTVDVLPEGLKLAGTTISGTPKTVGATVSTITGTSPTDGTTGSAIFNITILAKTEALAPVLSGLLVDPDKPGVNELTLFFVEASHPDNLPVTVTWDFGDGKTATGDFVENTYTAAGTYMLTVTATAGTKSTNLTQAVVVSDIDPNAPVISDFAVSPSPSVVGQLVTFTATTTDINGDAVTVAWDFGDGQSKATGNSVTFTYNTAGQYNVTAIATDATQKTSRTLQLVHFVGKGTGEDNGDEGDEVISFDGISQRLNFSEDGLIGLLVSETGQSGAFNRADMEADTDFGIQGRRSVKGGTPSVKVTQSQLIVAKTVVREKTTRKERGKARKTIGVSTRETKQTAQVEAEPEDKKMNTVKLKGDFFPSRSANTGSVSREASADSRATVKGALPSDKVTASGSIMMPAGLDLTNGTTIEVALGNILDKVVIDAKGKGKGKFTALQIKIKTDKATKKSIGDVAAKFSIKMGVAEMTTNGFDTEGVVVSKEQSGAELNIQCALLIGGVVYTTDNPVSLKVSPKEDKAQMVTRKVK